MLVANANQVEIQTGYEVVKSLTRPIGGLKMNANFMEAMNGVIAVAIPSHLILENICHVEETNIKEIKIKEAVADLEVVLAEGSKAEDIKMEAVAAVGITRTTIVTNIKTATTVKIVKVIVRKVTTLINHFLSHVIKTIGRNQIIITSMLQMEDGAMKGILKPTIPLSILMKIVTIGNGEVK